MSQTQRPKIKKVIEDFGEQRVNWWNYAEVLDYAENRWVRFTDDFKVPRGFTVVLDNDATIEVEMTLEGPVAVRTTGDVPQDNRRLLSEAVARLGARPSEHRFGGPIANHDDLEYARKQYGKHRLKPGYDLTDQKLKDVARVYLEATTDGRNCLAAVANHFKISPTTAKDWVRRARALGYLD